MFKNVASQKIQLFAFDTTTGAPKTGDAANITAYVSKDHGSVTALADTSATQMDATNAPGVYVFDLAQSETNADELTFSGKSSTSGVSVVPRMVTTFPTTGILAPEVAGRMLDVDSGGATKIQATLRSGQALNYIHFDLTDSTNHLPMTGASGFTVQRAIDNGAFADLASTTVVEIGYGLYRLNAANTDFAGINVTIRITAAGADPVMLTFTLEPAL